MTRTDDHAPDARPGNAAGAGAPSREARLAVFAPGRGEAPIQSLRASIGNGPSSSAPSEPWPDLEGCLAITFTSRTGSTFLCREIEQRFEIGPIREALNPPQIKSFALRHGFRSPEAALKGVVRKRAPAGGWFGFKAGPTGLVLGERLGLVERYWDRTRFVFLLRRDLVAQAVSNAKAELSGQFHSTQVARNAIDGSEYPRDAIHRSFDAIWHGVNLLARYHRAAETDAKRLYYEDFAGGNFGPVDRVLAGCGLPARSSALDRPSDAVSKLGDRINDAWADRFRREASPSVRKILDSYEREFLDR